MGEDTRTWKVGQLSQRTGLTVRTLHHYDQIGLLRPSARTSAGHRLYNEDDIRRLYGVIALRDLGVPLESIGDLLDGDSDIAELLEQHSRHVDRRLHALRALRNQLSALIKTVQEVGSPNSAELLDLIDEVNTMEETVNNYFSAQQRQQLAERREHVGEDAIREVEAEWPKLIADMQAHLEAGTDPADPAVGRLARRWMELLEMFHGGDEGLRDSLYSMRSDNSEEIRRQGGPSQELIEYVSRANQARGAQ